MSLYIRLDLGFWTHRKTIRLRALIGDAALWIPPRLWCYAAQNQPDGDFTGYLPAELAMLLGYNGDAQALLQALQQASFMDGMKIHSWEDHNSYHTTFADRAKKAAAARWKKGQEKKGKERKGKEPSNASSIEWIDQIKAMDCYKPLNIDSEIGKAQAWCMTNSRKCTQKFFLNWLNRSLDNYRTVEPAKIHRLPTAAEANA